MGKATSLEFRRGRNWEEALSSPIAKGPKWAGPAGRAGIARETRCPIREMLPSLPDNVEDSLDIGRQMTKMAVV